MVFSRYFSLRPLLLLAVAGAPRSLQAAPPVNNPVASFYGGLESGVAWTAEIRWHAVYDITAFGGGPAKDGAENLAAFVAARDAASGAGGGVVFFPAGTYAFSDNLHLADGVVIRGADPVGVTSAKTAGFAPPTRFEFPAYAPLLSGSGGDNTAAFKRILAVNPATASNLGVVNVDLNRAGLAIHGGVNGTNRNVLVFGVRSNNVAEPDPGVPTAWQEPWQRWSYRFAANIRVQAYANVLVANCRLNDAVTDNFDQAGYKISSNGNEDGTITTLTQPGRATFNYTNHYGIVVNRDGNGSGYSATPLNTPSLFREGVVIRDNYVFHTMRVAIHASGFGLQISDNVVRDQSGKSAFVDPTGRRTVSNAATLENRIIDFSGWNVNITGNDGQVYRHVLNGGPYASVDGEAILAQECCGGTLINGVNIRDNVVNSYIGLYKMQDIRSATIERNTVSGSELGIYVVADTNGATYAARDVQIRNNTVTGGALRLVAGRGVMNSAITSNTGSGSIIFSSGVAVSGNTGFSAGSASAVSPVNRTPQVELTAPAPGEVTEGASIVLSATASDSDGSVSAVEFYNNGALIATDGTAPFTCTLNAPPLGNHMLIAKAIDSQGGSFQSWPVYVRVVAAGVALKDFASWIAEFPGVGGLTGRNEDPDKDGVPNFMEFALANGNPVSNNPAILPAPTVTSAGESRHLMLTVQKNPAASGVSYLVEVSGNLTDWNSGAGHTVVLSDTPQTLVVRDAVAVESGAGRRHMRLKVTQQ